MTPDAALRAALAAMGGANPIMGHVATHGVSRPVVPVDEAPAWICALVRRSRPRPRECYWNAKRLAGYDARLTYVEGYASPVRTPFPVLHGWVQVEHEGESVYVDSTWSPPGVAYLGIAFPKLPRAASTCRAGSLLDDWCCGWPLVPALSRRSGCVTLDGTTP